MNIPTKFSGIRVVQLPVLMFALFVAFPSSTIFFDSSLLTFVLLGVHVLLLFVFIYLYCCLKQFQYDMILKSLKSNTTNMTSGTRTSYSSAALGFTTWVFSFFFFCWLRVPQSVVSV